MWVKEVKEVKEVKPNRGPVERGSRLDLGGRPDEMWVKEVKEVTPNRGPVRMRVSILLLRAARRREPRRLAVGRLVVLAGARRGE
eukprot:CAMPEP_0185478548 /NCGR_PEP_ID=MMETSP1366-20130426/4851_1 /TAXON_ID=38817 /ORGANISM="Gephyrocapsa oceanica, Strain RCC1303" /LENGTH=84 /DNA_ID=CAMNT_0028085819 /DNA_START=112 /DNA_END=367 /DNA_ORIENTATION=+